MFAKSRFGFYRGCSLEGGVNVEFAELTPETADERGFADQYVLVLYIAK